MLTTFIFHSISNANLYTGLYYKDLSSFTKMINSIGLWNKWFKGTPHTCTNVNWEKFNYATVGTWNRPWNLICSLNSFPPNQHCVRPRLAKCRFFNLKFQLFKRGGERLLWMSTRENKNIVQQFNSLCISFLLVKGLYSSYHCKYYKIKYFTFKS